MKIKSLFFVLCTALVLGACSKDDSIIDDVDGGVDPNGESWVALAVAKPAATRALNTPNQDPATSEESNMETVRAIFFNNANQVTKDYTLVGAEQGAAGAAGDAFKVPSSSTKVLIIVNPTSKMAATYAAGLPLTTVNAALTDIVKNVADPTAASGAGSFMMTNARGDLESITLHTTKTAAEGSPTALYVDRVVSKVRVYVTESSDDTNVTVSDAGWVLNVTNKKFFPMSQRIKTAVNTPTPFDRYGLGSYRIDPNYDNAATALYTEGGTDAVNADYIANYNYFGSTATPVPSSWNVPTTLVNKIAEYSLENTQNEAGNMHAYTTQVLLKAKFVPAKFYVPGDASGTPTATNSDPDKDWIGIGTNGFYTTETIVKWIEQELAAKYYHAKPSEFITPITTAYNAFIAGIGQTPVDVELNPDAGLSLTDAATKATEIAALFNATALKNAIKANGAAEVGNVSYYAEGVSYYKIMIKHDDNSTLVNALGEFGVVRNSVYDINVTKFNNPGYPVIPKPKPGTPDETNEGWLSIKIDINPWTWYTQDEQL